MLAGGGGGSWPLTLARWGEVVDLWPWPGGGDWPLTLAKDVHPPPVTMWPIPRCIWCHLPPVQWQNDRRLWKHNLRSLRYAGGNKRCCTDTVSTHCSETRDWLGTVYTLQPLSRRLTTSCSHWLLNYCVKFTIGKYQKHCLYRQFILTLWQSNSTSYACSNITINSSATSNHLILTETVLKCSHFTLWHWLKQLQDLVSFPIIYHRNQGNNYRRHNEGRNKLLL